MTANWSYDSQLWFSADTTVRLLAPNVGLLSEDCYGYVRSTIDARLIASSRSETLRNDLPWRDYDKKKILVNADELLQKEGRRHSILIGARNVVNEFGYGVRIAGQWYVRRGGPEPPRDWPVACIERDRLSMTIRTSAPEKADLLAGVPLVIDCEAVSREFVLANCSDQAHAFEIHPAGAIGPSAESWKVLSDAWAEKHQSGTSQSALARELERIAIEHGVSISENLLHSVLLQHRDGRIGVVAMTGSLHRIASYLQGLGATQAILLDNGGSVGWRYLPHEDCPPLLLLSGPNHRPRGMAFLLFDPGEFPQPRIHPALADSKKQ